MYDIPRRLWIQFEDVKNMNIFGGGTIDGNGEVWWKNSCKIKKTKVHYISLCSLITIYSLVTSFVSSVHVTCMYGDVHITVRY